MSASSPLSATCLLVLHCWLHLCKVSTSGHASARFPLLTTPLLSLSCWLHLCHIFRYTSDFCLVLATSLLGLSTCYTCAVYPLLATPLIGLHCWPTPLIYIPCWLHLYHISNADNSSITYSLFATLLLYVYNQLHL